MKTVRITILMTARLTTLALETLGDLRQKPRKRKQQFRTKQERSAEQSRIYGEERNGKDFYVAGRQNGNREGKTVHLSGVRREEGGGRGVVGDAKEKETHRKRGEGGKTWCSLCFELKRNEEKWMQARREEEREGGQNTPYRDIIV